MLQLHIIRPPVALKCVTVKQTEGALWEVICMPELFSTLRPCGRAIPSCITSSAAHTRASVIYATIIYATIISTRVTPSQAPP